ncbi:MAG: nucleoside hydrolase [Verrucomicrobia bacterium]|nr:nucleoside hydrolase [Verrucomicrobiota bacterium]
MIDFDMLALGSTAARDSGSRLIQSRMRVIIDNDFSGDPDDLFALVHHVLSPSIEIPLIIGSHLSVGDEWDPSNMQATKAKARAEETLRIMGLEHFFKVVEGSNSGLDDRRTPKLSAAAEGIITEAMRDDVRPLYLVCGAGLTDLASAYLIKPEIAKRLIVIWIGGPEYPDLAPPPPDVGKYEYNQRIDPLSAQVVFTDSDLQLWQVPRSSYRECLISYTEILTKVRPMGAIGSFLYDNIVNIYKWRNKSPPGLGETYILGDQPLVTLTALQASFHPEPSSSTFVTRPAPTIDENGSYEDNPNGRQIRIYTHIDVRLTFDDFFEKLALFAKS